ncbi:MAG: hypothetical protein ABH951_01150 [Patescibacteria group bacterium]
MCKDSKCAEEKKSCGFFKKLFGCKCEKDKSCCGGGEKKENPAPENPTEEKVNM